jgi:hypothetical protein
MAVDEINWANVVGTADPNEDGLIFNGDKLQLPDREGAQVGLFISDKWFSEGSIDVEVNFSDVVENHAAAEIVLFYDPQTRFTLNAGLTSQNLYSIRVFNNNGWVVQAAAGPSNAIQATTSYRLRASLIGSTAMLSVNGVEVLRSSLNTVLPRSQVGLFALGQFDILFSHFSVSSRKPHAFVVMQFSAPFHDVYSEVIKTVCDSEGIDAIRVDEVSGPGIIIQDIVKSIRDARVVIADVSPVNANVFYEVGFAHALNKPTILLAEKNTKLPFDVSPFRTLFYENSIGGKRAFEEGLRKHLRAVLQQPQTP